LILGAEGQDGYYLQSLLAEEGVDVVATSRKNKEAYCDVSDAESVEETIKQHKPSFVFHLAASSTTRHASWADQLATIDAGTWNVMESVRLHCPDSKVFVTGSGLQFRNEGEPISEGDPFHAESPYGVARIASAYTARYYRSLGLKTYIGYLFHHESPRRTSRHVSQKIALAATDVSRGKLDRVEIGTLSVVKEWGYAADIVEGIWKLVNQEKIWEATIGTGVGHSIGDWAKECFSYVGLDSADYLVEEKGFVPEYPFLVSNSSTIQSLGWRPKTSLRKLAEIFMTAPDRKAN
jgi:GDPmannose 4,6-dehydratase